MTFYYFYEFWSGDDYEFKFVKNENELLEIDAQPCGPRSASGFVEAKDNGSIFVYEHAHDEFPDTQQAITENFDAITQRHWFGGAKLPLNEFGDPSETLWHLEDFLHDVCQGTLIGEIIAQKRADARPDPASLRLKEAEATIASLRALLATATNEIEQLTTTIDEKWVEQIDALTQENKKLKLDEFIARQGCNQAFRENKALEVALAIVKDENEVNKKNFHKLMDEKKKKQKKPEKKNTKNEKGNRKVVRTDYRECAIFKIPDGVDLEDKSEVQYRRTKYGCLYIKYVGKEVEEEIEWGIDTSVCCDYKAREDALVDAGRMVDYTDEEE